MGWARIEDRAFHHPKIVAVSDKAFRLWVWGLCYANQYATDGHITVNAPIPARLKRAVPDLLKGGLWDTAVTGWQIHDYLDWNEKRADREIARMAAKERMRARRSLARSENVRENKPLERSPNVPLVLSGSVSTSKESTTAYAREAISEEDRLTLRAGDFVRRFREFHEQHRHGAKYLGHEHRDYLAAIELCRTWDDTRLDKLAVCFLTTNHTFAEDNPRTIPRMKALGSWLDSELKQWEAKHQIAG